VLTGSSRADSGDGASAVATGVARVSGVQAQHVEHVPEVEADGLDIDQHLSAIASMPRLRSIA